MGINGEAIDWDKELANLVQTTTVEEPATVKRGPATIAAHAIEDFWKALNGPAMSRQERTRHAIEENGDVRYLAITINRLV